MATHPDPAPDGVPPPDRIDPQSPPETPAPLTPHETPAGEPPEIVPNGPDFDQPDSAPPELPSRLIDILVTDRGFSTETGNNACAIAGQAPASMIEL